MGPLFGYIVAGESFDRIGSYDAAYLLFIILELVAAGIFMTINRCSPAMEAAAIKGREIIV